MSGDQYLVSYSFGFQWKTGVQTSAGAGDAGKLAALNANGKLDPSLLDAGAISGVTIGQGGGSIASNTAYGTSALLSNTTGNGNTGLGYESLKTNIVGLQNTALGYQSGKALTTSNNTFIGFSAGVLSAGVGGVNTGIGANALPALISGGQHTAVGATAGAVQASGINGVYIGCSSQAGANNANNEIVIGAFLTGLGSNTVRIGDASVTHSKIGGPQVVAALPAASATLQGARGFVTNATATLTAGIGTVVAGGGANAVPVICDGTNWRIG